MVTFTLDVGNNGNKLFVSFFLLTTGGSILISWSWIIKIILQFGMSIKENTYMSQLWEQNPMPLHLEVYAFNWTNPEDIYKPNVKPKFKEIGPFVFNEIKTKQNITWNTHNSTVTFQQYHHYYFNREKSVADLSLPITTLHPVLTSASYQAMRRNWGYFMRKGMQITFQQLNLELKQTRPIGAYLFEGFFDPLVTIANSMPFIKGIPPLDKFGWFYTRNGSSFEGVFNMGTAFHNFGVLNSWNYETRTSHYPGTCGELKGISAGELYQPYRTKDPISFFCPDMCRRVPLDFEKEEEFSNILGYKFSAGSSFLDNGTLHPENACFCEGECFPSGILNISSCKYGAPGFVSLPHFYKADEYYLNAVEGLKPDKKKHEFYITLEPLTSMPLRVGARLQLNLLLQPVKYINIFQNVPKIFFPILWFEEVVEIPTFLVIPLKLLLHTPLILQIVGVLLISLGFYLLSHIIYKQILISIQHSVDIQTRKKQKQQQLCTIKELVPLNQKPPVVFEVDVQFAGNISS